MRVVRLGQSVLGSIRIEEAVASGASVLRIHQFDVAGPASDEVTHVVQNAATGAIPKARLAALWTGKVWIVATALDNLCLWQIFGACDALGRI